MFSKKELVAVVEVDDPEWQATTFKKCLTGDQTWRDYLKMPENVKVSFRFIDPEPLSQNPSPPTSYFNFSDIFKKNKRRNVEQAPSPIPETFNELNHRLSKLELKIHELGAHKSESEISSSRENNQTRPNSCKYSRPQSPVVYTLNTQNLKFNKHADKNLETRCVETRCVETTDDKNAWICTNKQTQYSIPELTVMDTYCSPRYVDKSTSHLVSRCPSPITHPTVQTQISLSKAREELATIDKPDNKASQTSSLFHRISNFLQSVEKGCENKKDKDCIYHNERLRSGSSLDGRDVVSSTTDMKEATPKASRHKQTHPCRCCLTEKEKKSSTVINKMKRKSKRHSKRPAPVVSKSRSISCPDLEDMSKMLDEQAADIKDLKRMMGQCLERLGETMGEAQIESRREKKMMVKRQKQEEKLRKLQENIRKKQEKICKEQEKRKRKEQKRLQKYVQYMQKDQEKQEQLMRSEMIIKKQSLEHGPKKVSGISDQDSQLSTVIKEIKCPCKQFNDCRCSGYKRKAEKFRTSKY